MGYVVTGSEIGATGSAKQGAKVAGLPRPLGKGGY